MKKKLEEYLEKLPGNFENYWENFQEIWVKYENKICINFTKNNWNFVLAFQKIFKKFYNLKAFK